MTDVTTKIELVTEAIETLMLAQVHLCDPSLSDHDRACQAKNLVDARKCLSEALEVLMKPTFRVINGTGNTPQDVKVAGMNLA